MKRLFLAFTISMIFYSCKSDSNKEQNATNSMGSTEDAVKTPTSHTFFVGTYTHAESEGIYRYKLMENGHIQPIGLAAPTQNPSFLEISKNKKYLLAVNENQEGQVESYSIDGDSLTLVNRRSSEGANPCFISVNDDGLVLTANYSSGNVSLIRLDSDGNLSSAVDVVQHTGKGSSSRQKGPHAHSSWFVPDSRNVISVDLGTNEIWFFYLDENTQKLESMDPPKLALESGAGPRHLVFHPENNFFYVLNELNNTVSVIEKRANSFYEMKKSYSTLPNGFSGDSSGADIHISSDGRFLYASNRGHNSIAIFAVEKEGEELRLINNVDTKGDWPRNFSLSPDEKFLVVANQHSNNLVSYSRDRKSGSLKFVMSVEAPTPVRVLFE